MENIVNNITKLPHSFAIEGRVGAGKHLLADKINNKFFNVPYLDITEILNEETISNIYTYPQKRLYLIDISKINQKEQNKLLKFLEEPYENSYICLLTPNKYNLISTIRNRVIIYKINKYNKQELIDFAYKNNIEIDNKYFNTIIFTPGDILKLNFNNIDIIKIEELCSKIIGKIKDASFPNTLSIIDKLNFKDEYDKIDLDFFLRDLYYQYTNKYIETKDNLYQECLFIISITVNNFNMNNKIDKKKIISNMLIDLWRKNHEIKRS